MQAFSAWIHICAVRLFCESILRYGVPPKFLAALVKPNAKQVQKLRKLLAAIFASNGALPQLEHCVQRLASHPRPPCCAACLLASAYYKSLSTAT